MALRCPLQVDLSNTAFQVSRLILILTFTILNILWYFIPLCHYKVHMYGCRSTSEIAKKFNYNKVSKLLQLLLSKYCNVDHFLVLRYITKAEVSLSHSCSIFYLLLRDVYIFIFNYVKALQQSYHTGLLQKMWLKHGTDDEWNDVQNW